MVTPSQYENLIVSNYNLDEVIEKIDDKIIEYSKKKQYSWIHLILDDEYPKGVRYQIGRKYIENGWFKVYHRTSSENGERYGLTSFILTTQDNDTKFREAFMRKGNEYIEVA